jgi:agmatinase
MNGPEISTGSMPVGQVDGQKSPRYAGLTTFARLPRREDVPDFGVAVVGIPFDAGVSPVAPLQSRSRLDAFR